MTAENREDLPHSAKYVLDVIEEDGPCTVTHITDEVYYSKRTVKRALKQLREANCVSRWTPVGDSRQRHYDIRD